jgi:hypothetical protein
LRQTPVQARGPRSALLESGATWLVAVGLIPGKGAIMNCSVLVRASSRRLAEEIVSHIGRARWM